MSIIIGHTGFLIRTDGRNCKETIGSLHGTGPHPAAAHTHQPNFINNQQPL